MQSAGATSLASSLSINSGAVVQEVGYDSDCAEEVRTAFIEATGSELVDLDYPDVVDAVLLWFREDDDDLVDLLVDVISPLADNGVVWLMTPKPGRDGHVSPAEIADAAPTAGLQVTRTLSASQSWQGTRLVTPKSGRR